MLSNWLCHVIEQSTIDVFNIEIKKDVNNWLDYGYLYFMLRFTQLLTFLFCVLFVVVHRHSHNHSKWINQICIVHILSFDYLQTNCYLPRKLTEFTSMICDVSRSFSHRQHHKISILWKVEKNAHIQYLNSMAWSLSVAFVKTANWNVNQFHAYVFTFPFQMQNAGAMHSIIMHYCLIPLRMLQFQIQHCKWWLFR